MSAPIPTYSIVMVVHNTLAITQLATLRTLQHSLGQDARLVVVDNGSTDGTEEWLRLLGERGDIDLKRSETNLGHGPGIELVWHQLHSPYLVTLDSDAFPLSDDWLQRLRARLQGPVRVAGIRHHRDYIHPSCLMIARRTLEEFGLSFLNEKDQPSKFDVAERISHAIKMRGFQIAGLERTSSQRRGSVSEPVYLGSEYEGIVYHQWYTTRAARRAGRSVDDVSAERLDRSRQELFDRYLGEPRELTVVVGVRAVQGQAERLRNARVCLRALNLQDLPRWSYRVVVIEQDGTPRLACELAPLADRYLFVFNPGAYNRGWAFNIGASLPGSRTGALCLMDADLLVPPDFLRRGLARMRAGTRALSPFRGMVYLDSASSDRVVQDFRSAPRRALDLQSYRGRVFTNSQGGCIWVDSALYQEIGGHNECFRGWGREDREFWNRLARATTIERSGDLLLHLHHPQAPMADHAAATNRRLYKELSAGLSVRTHRPIGDLALYQSEGRVEADETCPVSLGARPWENWHRWSHERIQRIVHQENHLPAKNSCRRRLAELLVGLGDTLLDVGCGPGALWPHLEPYRARFAWTGVDATLKMVLAARRLFPHVAAHHGDACRLCFGDRSFDIVLLRHVLEHLPDGLMERALVEAGRVARRFVVVDFFVPPAVGGVRHVSRVGEDFLQTRWSRAEVEAPLSQAGWIIRDRLMITGRASERDEVWTWMRPQDLQGDHPSNAS